MATASTHSAPLSKLFSTLLVTKRGAWIFVGLFLVFYGCLLWFFLRPDSVRGWRESDTQTIALHFAEAGSSILRPRIDWGGVGPGYVEAEFQLYTWLVARFLRPFGDVPWAGQLVSLASTLGAGVFVFLALAREHRAVAAALGVLAFFSSRAVVVSATSVQPEALCLLLYSAALYAFLRYEALTGAPARVALAGFVLAGALAMLVKPTAAQLGISTFLLLFLRSRARLKTIEPWIAWAVILLLLGLHLAHAQKLYAEFGNTFGVLSGGDSKLPRLSHLLTPALYVQVVMQATLWGAGPAGVLALIACLVLRRNTALLLALLAGNAVWTLLALRYTSGAAGTLYHVLGAVLAAHAVATLVDVLAEREKIWVFAALALMLALWLVKSASYRKNTLYAYWDEPSVAAGDLLRRFARPRDIVVVRSVEAGYDAYWKTPNNFQDPRVFYRSNTRGFPVPLDDLDPRSIADPARRGARFYVEAIPPKPSPALTDYLTKNARLLATTRHGGRIFQLNP